MKKTLLLLALIANLAPIAAIAEEGDIVVRLRAVSVSPDVSSNLGKHMARNIAPGLMSPGAELAVNNNVIPKIDFSYYITKNIAAELILAAGSRHDVRITKAGAGAAIGNQDLGSINALPPTLTLQWHFMPDQTFDPYIGAGINYSLMLDRKLATESGAAAPIKIKVERDSWGPAIQAGFDINLGNGWLINADLKKIWMSTDVKAKNPLVAGTPWTKIDKLDIDPWVIGIGIGKKF